MGFLLCLVAALLGFPWAEAGKRSSFPNVCGSLKKAAEMYALRLNGGPSPCAGRVEVYHNQIWGTICDDHWDMKDAQVVCRELNCGTAIHAAGHAFYKPALGKIIWLDNVNCQGNETSLLQCQSSSWGKHNCRHDEDASADCSDAAAYLEEVSPSAVILGKEGSEEKVSLLATVSSQSQDWLRLVGGRDHCSGWVEVFHRTQWGTVCNDFWNVKDATVVCKQLGCGPVISVIGMSKYRRGSGPFWLEDVKCTGVELSLAECKKKQWGVSNCRHDGDAGVICAVAATNLEEVTSSAAILDTEERKVPLPPTDSSQRPTAILEEVTSSAAILGTEESKGKVPLQPAVSSRRQERVRLVGGDDRCSGRVEVFYKTQWGTVCDDAWDVNDATVVCKQLGCGAVIAVFGMEKFGRGSGPIWLDEVNCIGVELSLDKCKKNPWGVSNCRHDEDAGIVCAAATTEVEEDPMSGDPLDKEESEENIPSQNTASSKHQDRVRLVGGHDRCSGRVEVFYEAQWGTVCDDSWDVNDATVVCKQLGCGPVISVASMAKYGRGSGPIWLDEVNCIGVELSLAECKKNPWGVSNCRHDEDAGIICADSLGHPKQQEQQERDSFTTPTDTFQVRLADGPGRCVGRVEIYHSQEWGTVCSDGWQMPDAEVVCRELGCGSAESFCETFKPGTGRIWMDEFSCRGNESSLSQCNSERWGIHNCDHSKDVGVDCRDSSGHPKQQEQPGRDSFTTPTDGISDRTVPEPRETTIRQQLNTLSPPQPAIEANSTSPEQKPPGNATTG